MDRPSLINLRFNISETIQNPTHKLYLLFFLMIRHIQWHRPLVPCGYAPLPLVHIRLSISETFQNPTPKPYILLILMISRIQWHWLWIPRGYAPPLQFIKGLISQKLLEPYILLFIMIRCIQQDLSPDRIARLILHILFLENSKSVTLILTWPVCVCVCVCMCV